MTATRTHPSRARIEPTTRREDLLTVAAAAWMTAGLFLDGYAHMELLDGEESFFTPYHAVFYSGFMVSALAVYRVARARVRADTPLRLCLPTGYPAAALGLLVFALGGIGDGAWHTAYGVESGIDALLSPTHILLFVGSLMIVSAPFRSCWSRTGGHDSWPELLPAITSMTLSLCLIGFFFTYMWGPGFAGETRIPYEPETGAGEEALIIGVSTAIIPTAILFGGFGLMARRWRLPIGAAAVIIVVPNTLVIAAFGYDGNGVTAGFATALLIEALLARPTGRRWWPVTRRVLVLAPVAMWLTIFGLRALYDTVAWSVELWAGTVFLCGLTGAAVAFVLDPYEVP